MAGRGAVLVTKIVADVAVTPEWQRKGKSHDVIDHCEGTLAFTLQV